MSSESVSQETDDGETSGAEQFGLISNMEARSEHQRQKNYNVLYGITTTLGASLVVLILIWVFSYRKGLAWTSDPKLEFNWHPFLMVLGMLFIYSQSMLVYRTGRNFPKKTLKLTHAALHILAFILSVIGLKAVFDSHNLPTPPIANLYTLHSWIGLITVILFTGQFVFGFISFLYPGLPMTMRAAILPVHTHVGVGIFVFAAITAMMGFTEKAIWTLRDTYAELPSEAVLINFMGLILASFAVLSVYLVNDVTYKRVNTMDDNVTLTRHDE